MQLEAAGADGDRASSLAAAKAPLDPWGIRNLGVLLDPIDAPVTITGALAPHNT
jgi:hypothetical protein